MLQYFVVYKPFQVLAQFTSTDNKKCLKDFFDVPKDVYPVGRLDYDSEGLLLLTNDASLNHKLLNPSFQHKRNYWVQVDGMPTPQALQRLCNGVIITVDGKKYCTKKCDASIINQEPNVPLRYPPIRFRKNIPATWITLTLTEGKNRQVRKMTASVGFPTLRLIRYSIQNLTIENVQPGEMIQLTPSSIYQKLFYDTHL
jgi:23S rRNA pseudouridine2457 synthase